MASTESEPITEVWRGAPSWRPGGRVPGGGSGATPPEAEGFSAFYVSKESRTFSPRLRFNKVIKSHSERIRLQQI